MPIPSRLSSTIAGGLIVEGDEHVMPPTRPLGKQGSTEALAREAQVVPIPVHPDPLVDKYRFTKPCRSPGLTLAALQFADPA
jgi:hypothetical protein